MSRSITEIKVTTMSDGDFFRRIAFEWRDEAGELHNKLYCGFSAVKIFADLENSTAQGEDARDGFLLGLVRGISVERLI